MVEVACVKAWATNICNQLKSCTDRVQECIIAASKKKGIGIGGILWIAIILLLTVSDQWHLLKLMACHY